LKIIKELKRRHYLEIKFALKLVFGEKKIHYPKPYCDFLILWDQISSEGR